MPTASQIDPSVIRALPDDVRREQLAVIAQRESAKHATSQSGHGMSGGFDGNLGVIQIGVPCLGGIRDKKEIFGAVGEWIETSIAMQSSLEEEGLDEIRSYATSLIICGQLDTLYVFLKFLARVMRLRDSRHVDTLGFTRTFKRLYQEFDEQVHQSFGFRLHPLYSN